ncbi:MAG: hypothetical protein HQL53_06315 [Magnetococcales bacterium]|nr:hypothetical protein [Magnetococcales bacterium]
MSATITVKKNPAVAEQYLVTVNEDGSESQHAVNLTETTYWKMTGNRIKPEELVRASFAFLLEKEAKESILAKFDLPVIGDYFPEYKRVLGDYIKFDDAEEAAVEAKAE